ncbi:helix-turn-helix domain-containing protein [Microbacterium sp. B19(2022)]|uniref:helix-turn-helix domain-containing protein n=1 Tax=Microbacterium sp. B19(2022) TaxID=2914045 RepID=UPI003FD0E492
MKLWLTLSEAADAAGRTERTIRNWVEADELKARHGRYLRDEVLAAEKRMRRRIGRPRKAQPGEMESY